MVKLWVVSLSSDSFCVINVSSIVFPLSPSHKRCHKISITNQNGAFSHSPNHPPSFLVMVDLWLGVLRTKGKTKKVLYLLLPLQLKLWLRNSELQLGFKQMRSPAEHSFIKCTCFKKVTQQNTVVSN